MTTPRTDLRRPDNRSLNGCQADTIISLSSGNGASGSTDASSVFNVVFSLDALTTYLLSGSVDTQAILTGGAGLPSVTNSVRLLDELASTTIFETLTADESFSVSGQLAAGTYRLIASAATSANQSSVASNARSVSGTSSFSLSFTTTDASTPVPEPATLALTGLGLAAAAALRRRARG